MLEFIRILRREDLDSTYARFQSSNIDDSLIWTIARSVSLSTSLIP